MLRLEKATKRAGEIYSMLSDYKKRYLENRGFGNSYMMHRGNRAW